MNDEPEMNKKDKPACLVLLMLASGLPSIFTVPVTSLSAIANERAIGIFAASSVPQNRQVPWLHHRSSNDRR